MVRKIRLRKRHARYMIIGCLAIALSLLAMHSAASAQNVTSPQYVSGDIHNASNKIIIYPTPIPTVYPTTLPSTSSLSGYVLDSRGNKVPRAYVTLYINSAIAPIAGNPAYTGNISGSDVGQYHFSGLTPGNYTVIAEKDDIWLYNGSASIWLLGYTDGRLDVTLNGYVYSPFIENTPTPAPTEATAALPVITPTSPAVVKSPGGMSFNLILIVPIIFGIIIVIGVVIIYRMNKKPVTRRTAQNRANMAPVMQTIKPKAPESVPRQAGTGYAAEIEELAKLSFSNSMTDPNFIKRINDTARKYGISQSQLFYDINKASGSKSQK